MDKPKNRLEMRKTPRIQCQIYIYTHTHIHIQYKRGKKREIYFFEKANLENLSKLYCKNEERKYLKL